MRPVCRMLVYWLCFVSCMVWVTEGQLKKTRHLRLRTKIPQKLKKLFFTFLKHEIPQAATTV